jgi:hypothetical protein
MYVNVILSPNATSNRVRGNYLGALDNKGERYNKQIDIVINNFSYNEFDNSKISILDISDGILTPPRSYGLFGSLYHKLLINKRKISYIRKFDGVVCASIEQYRVLKKYVSNVYIVPDLSHYHHRYERKNRILVDSVLKFVWDGQSVNFQNIKLFIEENKSIFTKPDVSLYIITDEFMSGTNFNIRQYIESLPCNVHFVKWDEETFIDNVRKCDVGIAIVDMKCKHNLLKPENKLVNYVGLGLTAIASNTLAYSTFAKNCPDAIIICNKNSEWVEAIESMRRKKEELSVFGEQARKYVIDNYSESILIDTWIDIISDLQLKHL